MKRKSMVMSICISIYLMTNFFPKDLLCQQLSINRNDYTDKLRGLWLGECIANWTGIQTEGDRSSPPFYTDDNWSSFGFILNQDPWMADDDTDIEYVYLYLLNHYSLTTLTPDQIRKGWMTHINNWIWVSNARVRSMFDQGVLPPATSLLNVNELAIQIDAQLTTEIFGALTPGMVHKGLKMVNLPILTTANSHAAHASQFHAILRSLAVRLDTTLSGRDQALWLIDESSTYFPNSSKIIDIVNFVRDDFLSNPDLDDWESTRDKIYERYQLNDAANGFKYAGWTESSINFAAGVMALLYGEMDYRRTVQIGTLAGWDSDNPTATMAGLLGLIYGYVRLVAEFPEQTNFSDRYNVNSRRDALPDYLPEDSEAQDTFTMIAERMLPMIDMVVTEAGGTLQDSVWLVPDEDEPHIELNPLYELMQRSANNRVRANGGSVTASSSVGGTRIEALADGFEHDFNGEEWFGEAPDYYSDVTDSATLTVTYDQPVMVHTIRLIEGNYSRGFIDADVEIKTYDSWSNPAGGVYQSALFDASQKLQIIDFELNNPEEATAIRISGAVDQRIRILELDALSEPWSESSNKPPSVSIISPEDGERFNPPANIIINAEASDRDGQVSKVEFYNVSSLIGTDTTSPYSMTWENVPAGFYQLYAKAIDDKSAIAISEPRGIVVADSSQSDTLTWHSYDLNTTAANQPIILFDQENAAPAPIELYESIVNDDVDKGNLFSVFNSGVHLESFNHVEKFWANSSGASTYPYAGKSTMNRGSDSGEDNTPVPLGVRDLQLHPPDNSHLTVAAFVVPYDGYYRVSNLAVRRVYSSGGSVTYKVFDTSKTLITSLRASNNRIWVTDDNTYSLDVLRAGNRIYFTVGNYEDYSWDATEIAWTVTYYKEDSVVLDNPDLSIPKEYALKQNYPNPFNAHTQINYELTVNSKISLWIFDILGQKVRTLKDDFCEAGKHSVTWDGRNDEGHSVASGLYVIQMRTETKKFSKKVMLLQ